METPADVDPSRIIYGDQAMARLLARLAKANVSFKGIPAREYHVIVLGAPRGKASRSTRGALWCARERG